MTDALHPVGTRQSEAVATLTGVVVGESDCAIRVRVADGTWTFQRRDVLAIRQPAADAAAAPADAVLVDIRPGTTADFTRPMRIDVGERPLTLGAPASPACGEAQLHRLTESWAARLHLTELPAHAGAFTWAQTRSRDGGHGAVHSDSLD